MKLICFEVLQTNGTPCLVSKQCISLGGTYGYHRITVNRLRLRVAIGC